MKKFWLIMLSLGLVTAFSASAFAVDVKLSGEYYVAGMYLNKTRVDDADTNPSTAFFYQRLRVGTDFIVSPGLKLVTRFDALERIWGGSRSNPGTTLAVDSAGTVAENENIAFDYAYIDYQSPIGIFKFGYMQQGATGTVFGDSTYPGPRIRYYSNRLLGHVNINADISRLKDYSDSAVYPTTATDADDTSYGLEGVYSWKDGKAGMKVFYYRYAEYRPASNYRKDYFLFVPYAIFKIGPAALQAEFNYASGKDKEYDNPTQGSDVRLEQMSGWIDATATFAPLYVGATFAYVSGDDPNTKDVKEGGTLTGGRDWNPCLIMFNYYDVANWIGDVQGYDSSKVTGPMTNAWFFREESA